MYTRFWFEFKRSPENETQLGVRGVLLGCGVTAESEEAAIELMRRRIFGDHPFEIERVIPNVLISDLEQNHVAPNIEPDFIVRGIWYPRGYR